jgi:hypothetical protein
MFIEHKPSYMSHVLLAHLSKDNNCPDLALKMFAGHAGDTHISVASRYEESPVFVIDPLPVAAGESQVLNQITGQFQFAIG